MEDKPKYQETKGESKKSRGREDGGPYFATAAQISSGNDADAKTLIKYDTDETLYIKEEIVPDHEIKSESITSTERQDGGPYSYAKAFVESLDIKQEIVQNEEEHQQGKRNLLSGKNQLDEKCINTVSENSGAKTVIEYETDESLDIKEEIVEDEELHQPGNDNNLSKRNHLDEKCIATEISSDNNSDTKTLIKYDFVETLVIKQEILQDEEQNLDEKCTTTGISSENNSGFKTLIENDHDQTLEIKKETIQDQQNTVNSIKVSKNYKKSRTLDTSDDIEPIRKPRTYKKKQKFRPKREKKYKCEKCARSYVWKEGLSKHQKFECNVIPQFSCEFCGKRFKQKSATIRHVDLVHLKGKPKTPPKRHNCDKCPRSYRSLGSLNNHKREEHAAVRPQFICDICGFQTKRKYYLSRHITSQHLNL